MHFLEKQARRDVTKARAERWQQATIIIEHGIEQLTQAPHHIPADGFTRQQVKHPFARISAS